MLGHVSGGEGPVRNYVQDTHQTTLNETSVNMLAVGVCESVSVHTVTLLAGRKDTGL